MFITNAKNLMFMTIHKRQKRIVYLQHQRIYCAQAHDMARSSCLIFAIWALARASACRDIDWVVPGKIYSDAKSLDLGGGSIGSVHEALRPCPTRRRVRQMRRQ